MRQKLKLRLAVGLLVSVLSVSFGLSAHAANKQADKAPGRSSASAKSPSKANAKSAARTAGKAGSKATTKTAGKSAGKNASRQVASKSKVAMGKSQRAKVARLAPSSRSARATRNARVAKAQPPSRVARSSTAARMGLMPAVAAGSVARAQVTPVAVDASGMSTGRTPIASPAASAATGASYGQIYGLHQTQDPLELKSSVAFVVDQETNEVLLAKNSEAVLPIASLTKLMTAMVIVEARLPMDEVITITDDDIDFEKNSSSRLRVGTTMPRGEALHLALMASENRAAHALGRTFPGGLSNFISLMNAKARQLGMRDSHYVDPTGLNSRNQSSAKDLASLVKAAYQQPLIREMSISPEHSVQVGQRQVRFGNTNSLVKNPVWDIGLQKTGYIVEAGRCLVMQARMAGRKLIMVFLDSSGKYSRQADAERVRRWLEGAARGGQPSAALEPSVGLHPPAS